MVRHKNSYGIWENLDSLPVRDCGCNACNRARRSEDGGTSRRPRTGRGRNVADGLAMAVGLSAAVAGTDLTTPADPMEQLSNNYETSQDAEADRRSRTLDESTRDAGQRRRRSGSR